MTAVTGPGACALTEEIRTKLGGRPVAAALGRDRRNLSWPRQFDLDCDNVALLRKRGRCWRRHRVYKLA